MGTLLKAYLKNTDDPIEMFFDYTDSILKADTGTFLQAMLDDGTFKIPEDLRKDIEAFRKKFNLADYKKYKENEEDYREKRNKLSNKIKSLKLGHLERPRQWPTKLKPEEKKEKEAEEKRKKQIQENNKKIKEQLKTLEEKHKAKQSKLQFARILGGVSEPSKDEDESWLSNERLFVDEKNEKRFSEPDKLQASKKELKEGTWTDWKLLEETTGWEEGPNHRNRNTNLKSFLKILDRLGELELGKKERGLIGRLREKFDELLDKSKPQKDEKAKGGMRQLKGFEKDAVEAGKGKRRAVPRYEKKALTAITNLKSEFDKATIKTDGEGTYIFGENVENPLNKIISPNKKQANEDVKNLREIAEGKRIPLNITKDNYNKFKKDIDIYIRQAWYSILANEFDNLGKTKQFTDSGRLFSPIGDGKYLLNSIPYKISDTFAQYSFDSYPLYHLKEMLQKDIELKKKDRWEFDADETALFAVYTEVRKDDFKEFEDQFLDFENENSGVNTLQIIHSKGKPKLIPKPEKDTSESKAIENLTKMKNMLNEYVKFSDPEKGGDTSMKMIEALEWVISKGRWKGNKLWKDVDLDNVPKTLKEFEGLASAGKKYGKKYSFAFRLVGKKDKAEEINETKDKWESWLQDKPTALKGIQIILIKSKKSKGKETPTIASFTEDPALAALMAGEEEPKTREEPKNMGEVGTVIIKFKTAHKENNVNKKMEGFAKQFDLKQLEDKTKTQEPKSEKERMKLGLEAEKKLRAKWEAAFPEGGKRPTWDSVNEALYNSKASKEARARMQNIKEKRIANLGVDVDKYSNLLEEYNDDVVKLKQKIQGRKPSKDEKEYETKMNEVLELYDKNLKELNSRFNDDVEELQKEIKDVMREKEKEMRKLKSKTDMPIGAIQQEVEKLKMHRQILGQLSSSMNLRETAMLVDKTKEQHRMADKGETVWLKSGKRNTAKWDENGNYVSWSEEVKIAINSNELENIDPKARKLKYKINKDIIWYENDEKGFNYMNDDKPKFKIITINSSDLDKWSELRLGYHYGLEKEVYAPKKEWKEYRPTLPRTGKISEEDEARMGESTGKQFIGAKPIDVTFEPLPSGRASPFAGKDVKDYAPIEGKGKNPKKAKKTIDERKQKLNQIQWRTVDELSNFEAYKELLRPIYEVGYLPDDYPDEAIDIENDIRILIGDKKYSQGLRKEHWRYGLINTLSELDKLYDTRYDIQEVEEDDGPKREYSNRERQLKDEKIKDTPKKKEMKLFSTEGYTGKKSLLQWRDWLTDKLDELQEKLETVLKDYEPKKYFDKGVSKPAKYEGVKIYTRKEEREITDVAHRPKEVKKMGKTTNQRVTWREILKVN